MTDKNIAKNRRSNPPLVSQYLDILQNIHTQIVSLGLTFSGNPVPVLVKKISRWTPNISLPPLPVIFVTGEDRPESIVPWDTEDNVLAKYISSIVLIAAGNQDNTANLDVWLNWREQERRLFQWGMSAQIEQAFFSEFAGEPAILREAFLKNYDVSGFNFVIWNVEPRTNPP